MAHADAYERVMSFSSAKPHPVCPQLPEVVIEHMFRHLPDFYIPVAACVNKQWWSAAERESRRRGMKRGLAIYLDWMAEAPPKLRKWAEKRTGLDSGLLDVQIYDNFPAKLHEIISHEPSWEDLIFNSTHLTKIIAGRSDGLKILKWARDPKARPSGRVWDWDAGACSMAAFRGDLELLKWLRDPTARPDGSVCPWSTFTLGMAAKNGHLEVLKWMRDPEVHGSRMCDFSPYVAAAAAEGGQLEVLKWLRDPALHRGKASYVLGQAQGDNKQSTAVWLQEGNICPWDDTACSKAAEAGHLEVLKWLRDPAARADGSVCPWSERTYKGAIDGEQLEILRWLRDPDGHPNGDICPWDAECVKNYALSHMRGLVYGPFDSRHRICRARRVCEWLEENIPSCDARKAASPPPTLLNSRIIILSQQQRFAD